MDESGIEYAKRDGGEHSRHSNILRVESNRGCEFVRGCRSYADYQPCGLMPRPLNDTVHDTVVGEVVNIFLFYAEHVLSSRRDGH